MTETGKRLFDLSGRSYAKNIYVFSDFLSESQLVELKSLKFEVSHEEFGGCEFATRKMVRFGSDCYGGCEFPLIILKISAKSEKFAVEISHRDVLGAVMNLGVVREKIGDIFCDNKTAFVVSEKKIAEYISENLEKVGRNVVRVEFASEIPASFAPRTEKVRLSVSSARLDGVICKLYNISREGVLELFRAGKVMLCGVPIENNSKNLTGGEVVSVRGFGKFEYIGDEGVSKKGRKYVGVEVYK